VRNDHENDFSVEVPLAKRNRDRLSFFVNGTLRAPARLSQFIEVPEPNSLVLLLLGTAIALACFYRRFTGSRRQRARVPLELPSGI
jgi:hypothetical protein